MMKEKEEKRVPQLRFPEFTDDWEQRKVFDVAPLQRGFDLPSTDIKNGKYPVVMSNGIGAYHSEYKAEGPGVVTGRSGTIGKLHYIKEKYWPHNTTLWVTNFKGNNPKFIYYMFQCLDLSRFGTGSGVPTLNRNDVHDDVVSIPSGSEQIMISEYLTTLDHLITLHQRKLEKLKKLKKGLVQKLFSQKVRFKADDGSEFPEWEEKKLGELGTFIKGAALSKADISEYGSPFILYGELYTTYKEVAYNIQRRTQAIVDKKYYSCIGDVVIPTSGESAEEISTATCVMVPNVILGGDLNIFRSDIVDGRIMSYILNHQVKWKIAMIAQGKSIVHIQAKQLSNIYVKYPVSKVEQQKIADCLSLLDDVIEKQKVTLAAWEEMKKGLLQQMFV